MKSKYVSRTPGCSRLILIYAGWGMDWHPFARLQKNGYDIMVIWDYTTLDYPMQKLARYDEICLLAWSMGVFAASITIHEILPRVTKRIAVNGTLMPIHPTHGIPPQIFAGTLDNLTPGTLRKFYRRMCMSAEQFAEFMNVAPCRKVDDLRAELAAIEQHTYLHPPQMADWDLALVSAHDAIFGKENLKNAWRGRAPIQQMEAAHLPDFAMILSRLFIDKPQVATRFADAAGTYAANAGVQERMAHYLMDFAHRVAHMPCCGGHVLEIGPGQGALTRLICNERQPGHLMLWDIVASQAAAYAPDAVVETVDAETRIRTQVPASLDFIFSASTIQWLNSPALFLRNCWRALAPGGWLVLATFAHGNMPEVTSLLGNGLPLPTLQGWLSMIPQPAQVLESAEHAYAVHFDTPRQLLEHLSRTGVNAVDYGRSSAVLARRLLENLVPDGEGKYPLTYRAVYIVARKPVN